MAKFKTKINYYNNGKLISSSVLTKPRSVFTQAAVNVAMVLILDIHKQQPPFDAYATLTEGKQELERFNYIGDK